MRTRRRTNLVWGLLLVALALVVVLHALGNVPEGIYDLFLRAWPVLLVFAGLSIFLRPRMALGNWLALVISVALVVGVSAMAFNARVTQQRDDYQEPVAQVVSPEVTLLRLRLDMQTADIEILPATIADRQINGLFSGSVESDLETTYSQEGASATLSLVESQSSAYPLLENVGRGTLRLELPPGLPLDVEIQGDSGDVLLNTSGLSIERMNLDLQEGDALVTLPAYEPLGSQGSESLGTLAVRNGDITLSIPPEVGARLELNRGGSGIEPEYDPAVYNFLVGDVLEARNIENAGITARYTVTAPRGRIRVQVSE
ncbi:MAG: hypothetical protein K8L99_30180 [Anaerolineae bacterium]|nr:hypothetical protein [Anaerolineae bacterium]